MLEVLWFFGVKKDLLRLTLDSRPIYGHIDNVKHDGENVNTKGLWERKEKNIQYDYMNRFALLCKS